MMKNWWRFAPHNSSRHHSVQLQFWITTLILSSILILPSLSQDSDGYFRDPNYICEARCLGNMKREVSGVMLDMLNTEPHIAKTLCLWNDTNCAACCKACESSVNVPEQSCVSECKLLATSSEVQACSQSCQFLKQVYKNPPMGNCPPLESHVQSKDCSGRLESCTSDHDCPRYSKRRCCPTSGCRGLSTCQKMVQYGVPPTPDMTITLHKKENEEGMQEFEIVANWSNFDFKKVQQPVLFRLQVRSGAQKQNLDTTDWKDLIITTKVEIGLSQFFVAQWYQFRIWSYSELGSDGPGPISQAVYIPNQNLVLTKPYHLRESLSRIHGDSVDVTISWNSPNNHNKKLSGYLIKWVQIWGNTVTSVRKNAAKVPASQNFYTIKDLKLSSRYKIKVRAFTDDNKKSRAANLFLNTVTIPPPPPYTISERITRISNKDRCRCGINRDAPVVIHPASIRANQLEAALELARLPPTPKYSKVELKWEPQVCIDNDLNSFYPNQDPEQPQFQARAMIISGNRDTYYYLTGLHYQCNYRLQIRQFFPNGRLAGNWSTCFCTPSCQKLKNCQSTESIVPNRPEDLKIEVDHQNFRSPYVDIEFELPDQFYQATISWKYPNNLHLIRGYRLIWGPRVEEPIDEKMYNYGISPQLNSKKAQQKVLDGPNHNTFHVFDLSPGTLYIVKVQALGESGDSETQSIFFTTPDKEKNSAQSIFKSIFIPLTILSLNQIILLHFLHS